MAILAEGAQLDTESQNALPNRNAEIVLVQQAATLPRYRTRSNAAERQAPRRTQGSKATDRKPQHLRLRRCRRLRQSATLPRYRTRSSQNATALAAATFRESTSSRIGIFTV